jgi:uncharacterized protein (DUF58 family)
MFHTVDALLVTPEVVTLPRVDPTGRWTAGSVAAGGRIGGTGEDDAGTRPYRLGDEFRRVHWRTTARTGELSVRREEQPRQGAVTLLLDTRASAWPPGTARGLDAGPAGGSFETAVSAVASMAVALASAGTAVHLITLDGEELGRIPGGRWSTSAEVGAVLNRLASVGVGPAGRARPPAPLLATDDRVVAVLGRRRVEVATLPTSTVGPGLALVVGADADVSALTAAGWLATTLPRLSALPLLWQHFGTTATSAGRWTMR